MIFQINNTESFFSLFSLFFFLPLSLSLPSSSPPPSPLPRPALRHKGAEKPLANKLVSGPYGRCVMEIKP